MYESDTDVIRDSLKQCFGIMCGVCIVRGYMGVYTDIYSSLGIYRDVLGYEKYSIYFPNQGKRWNKRKDGSWTFNNVVYRRLAK